ncbi:MAG: hypothetical protein KDI80_05425 [Xanthomonadales bacterium]|nr:hypothetical protein [Xanthomonadales bacterium]
MDSPTLIVFHVAISVIAIVSGLLVLRGLLLSRLSAGLTACYLLSSIVTCLTGYLFQRAEVLPSHVVGAVTLAILVLAALARYGFALHGCWRFVFVISLVLSLWLNVFVLVAQAFLKVAPLHALAPNGSEPAFLIAQLIVLCIFLVFGVRAMRNFHPPKDRSGTPF